MDRFFISMLFLISCFWGCSDDENTTISKCEDIFCNTEWVTESFIIQDQLYDSLYNITTTIGTPEHFNGEPKLLDECIDSILLDQSIIEIQTFVIYQDFALKFLSDWGTFSLKLYSEDLNCKGDRIAESVFSEKYERNGYYEFEQFWDRDGGYLHFSKNGISTSDQWSLEIEFISGDKMILKDVGLVGFGNLINENYQVLITYNDLAPPPEGTDVRIPFDVILRKMN